MLFCNFSVMIRHGRCFSQIFRKPCYCFPCRNASISPIIYSEPNTCPRAASCATLPVWAGLYKAINTYLDSITLQDLLEQEHKNDDYSYVI